MHQGRTVRVPVHVLREFAQVLAARRQLIGQLSRMPTIDELARSVGKPVAAVAELFCVTDRISSLDEPVFANDDRALIEQLVIEGDHAVAPQAPSSDTRIVALARKAASAAAARARATLRTQRRRRADPGRDRRRAQVTRERVRQIQSEALLRLRKLVEQDGATPHA